MITKEQHIDFWMNTAEEDWTTVGVLFAMDRYLHCLFWAHLMLEKLAKAIWVKKHDGNEMPPAVNRIVQLLEESGVDLGQDKMEFLASFNEFQLSNQNPDFMNYVYKVCKSEFTSQELNKVQEVRTSLLKMLP